MKTFNTSRAQMTPEQLERRRLRALPLFHRGFTQYAIGKRLGVTKVAVHYWYKAWKAKGRRGLLSRTPGVTAKLSDANMIKVEEALMRGPQSYGYTTQLWTLPRITDVVKKVTGVSYADRSFWHVLRRLNWSCQKPERRPRERDEVAIKRWKEKEWPAIQKKGSASA